MLFELKIGTFSSQSCFTLIATVTWVFPPWNDIYPRHSSINLTGQVQLICYLQVVKTSLNLLNCSDYLQIVEMRTQSRFSLRHSRSWVSLS